MPSNYPCPWQLHSERDSQSHSPDPPNHVPLHTTITPNQEFTSMLQDPYPMKPVPSPFSLENDISKFLVNTIQLGLLALSRSVNFLILQILVDNVLSDKTPLPRPHTDPMDDTTLSSSEFPPLPQPSASHNVQPQPKTSHLNHSLPSLCKLITPAPECGGVRYMGIQVSFHHTDLLFNIYHTSHLSGELKLGFVA